MVQLDDLDNWRDTFETFHARFAHLFARSESREQVAKYLRGLLAPIERKSGWQVAEAVGDATLDRMQRLLYRVDWDADAARDILQSFVIETFGHPDGIGVLDETGFLKKGIHSVGVQRQYKGGRRLLEVALPLPPRSPELRLVWSHWHRHKRCQSRRGHYRRRPRAIDLFLTKRRYIIVQLRL